MDTNNMIGFIDVQPKMGTIGDYQKYKAESVAKRQKRLWDNIENITDMQYYGIFSVVYVLCIVMCPFGKIGSVENYFLAFLLVLFVLHFVLFCKASYLYFRYCKKHNVF